MEVASSSEAMAGSKNATSDATLTDACVGSINHVLDSAFKGLRFDPQMQTSGKRRSKLRAPTSSAPSSSVKAVSSGKEGCGQEPEHDSADSAGDHLPTATSPESGDERDNGGEETFEDKYDDEFAAIDDELEAKKRAATTLLQRLFATRAAAAAADLRLAREYKDQGVLLGSHLPIGDMEISHEQELGEEEAQLGPLLAARDILQSYRAQSMRESGNLPWTDDLNFKSPTRRISGSAAEGGSHWLTKTSATVHREALNIPSSYGPAGSKRHRPAPTGKQDPESSSTWRRQEYSKNLCSQKVRIPSSKNCNSLASRAAAAAEMERMGRGLGFLRHPKHDERSRWHTAKVTSAMGRQNDSSGGYFVSDPPVLKFQDYEAGEVYRAVMRVRNVSALARSCRILPVSNATPYFAISRVDFPQGNSATIAPGMAVEVAIDFFPETRGDYSSELAIMTEAGPVVVPLEARRRPPDLDLPADGVIKCGACLLGTAKTHVFRVKNSGGDVRLRFLRDEDLEGGPAEGDLDERVRIGPFDVYPTELSLPEGESAEVSVLFAPVETGSHCVTLTIIQDNCEMRALSLQAYCEQAQIDIIQVDECIEFEEGGELTHLYFNGVTMGGRMVKSLRLRNPGLVPLPISWNIDAKKASTFSVQPPLAVLQPGSDCSFAVSFSPSENCAEVAEAKIVIEGVPPEALPSLAPTCRLEGMPLHFPPRLRHWFRSLSVNQQHRSSVSSSRLGDEFIALFGGWWSYGENDSTEDPRSEDETSTLGKCMVTAEDFLEDIGYDLACDFERSLASTRQLDPLLDAVNSDFTALAIHVSAVCFVAGMAVLN
jgi:hypothetical protein